MNHFNVKITISTSIATFPVELIIPAKTQEEAEQKAVPFFKEQFDLQ